MFRKIKQFVRHQPLLFSVVALGAAAAIIDYTGRPNFAWIVIFITGTAVLIRSTIRINDVVRHGYFGITLLPVIALLTALILRETWTALVLQLLLVTEQPLVGVLDKKLSRQTTHATISKTQHSSLHRLFDRISLPFTVLILLIAGGSWLLNNDVTLFLSTTAAAAVWPLLFVTPLLYVSGLSRADRQSLFIRSAVVLERLADTKHLFIRKTGIVATIDDVESVHAVAKNSKTEVLRVAASLAASSEHVLSKAIAEHALQSQKITPAKHTKEAPGLGISGRMRGQTLLIGSPLFLKHSGVVVDPKIINQTQPTVYVARDDQLIGYITFKESFLPGAKSLRKQLQKVGIPKMTLISNDSTASIAATAKTLHISEYLGAHSSDQTVRTLHQNSNRPNAFVGSDAQDDAALVAADVGIVTQIDSTAHNDVILQDYNVHDIVKLFKISKQVIRRSLASTILLTAIALVATALAATGFFTPLLAALVHAGVLALSVAIVLLSAATTK